MTTPESYRKENPHLVEAFSDSLSPLKTAFNDLNTVERVTDIDIQSSAGTSVLRDVKSTTNSGNIPQDSQSSGELLVETGTTSSSTASLETASYGQYTAGYIAQQGIGIRVPSQPVDDAYAEWGYNNGNNGFYWGYDSTGLYVARLRNGTVEGKTYRSNWNGLDPDQIRSTDFDPSEGAIYQINFAWYGYGAIEFRIISEEEDTEQEVVKVHTMAVPDKSSITNPNQPIRVYADNGTSTNNVQVYVGGRQFSILGQPTDNFRITSQTNTGVSVANGSWTHVQSMKRKSTDDRRANIEVRGADITTDADVRLALVVNPSLSSTSYSSLDLIPDSETSLEQSGAGTFDGIGSGVKIWEGLVSSSQGGSSVDETVSDINQSLPREQPVSLIANGIGSTATVNGTLRLREEW